MTSGAALVVQPGAVPEARWQVTGDMTTTADLVLQAATASYRNYVTDFSYQNTGATATFVVIKDVGVVVWKGFAPANMAVPAVVSLCSPLRANAVNTAFNAACLTAGAAVSFNACGYKAL
jgi:carbamoylphosphate synthase small subunit